MTGKIAGAAIVATALIAGIAIYYLQTYAFYEEVSYEEEAGVVLQLTNLVTDTPEPILVDSFQGIDANSSPLRFRACFSTPMSVALLTETFVTYEAAEPTTGPSWFECYDAKQIGADLETGTAFAFLSERDIGDGIDRVIAVYEDGRAYVWHQLNEKYRD
ncbi:MAG: DUF6446 family protein [Pseudoruegeria sp.]